MTDSETVDTHPYVSGGEAFSGRWTSDAYTLQLAGRIVATVQVQAGVMTENVSGPCPRCHDLFSSVTVVSTPVVKGPLAVQPGHWTPVLVRCSCNQPHEGRPDRQASGCGARYNVSAEVVTA